MPNVLAHFGVQTVASRGLIRRADFKWIFLGCVIPDVSWILLRAIATLAPGVDPYGLRLYGIAQASLIVSLLLCGALALLSARPRLVFGILSLNTLLHLLLDATQTKWGNGVHLLAPFSWQQWNAGLYWPDSLITYILTAGGLAAWAWAWLRPESRPVASGRPAARAVPLTSAALLLAAYLTVPLGLGGGPLAADNLSVRTLVEREARVGRPVQFDRERYERGSGGDSIFSFAKEGFAVQGERARRSTRVSAKGTFVAPDTVRIHALHEHPRGTRDLFSYLGLLLLVMYWIRALWAPTG
ncbi:MAG: hypothetical protein P8X82_08050 [Gemmatimonadales bacterium]